MALNTVIAGTTVQDSLTFIIPSTTNTAGGTSVSYSIMDTIGSIYATGTATNAITQTTAGNNLLLSTTANIAIPSTIPPNTGGSKYILQWTLVTGGQTYIQSDLFTVLATTESELGAVSQVELVATNVTLAITLPVQVNDLTVSVYQSNVIVQNSLAQPLTFSLVVGGVLQAGATSTGTSNGWLYTIPMSNSSNLPASLTPYTLVWSYDSVGVTNAVESSNLYLVNPSMLSAMEDIKKVVDKSNMELGAGKGLYTTDELLSYLRRGMEEFNGTGQPTAFTMINATGPVRNFWLSFASIIALRAQALYEGVRAFQFSGQSINLAVDRSSYFNNMADIAQNSVMQTVMQFKSVLSRRGLVYGDGNVNPLSLQPGAIGSVGISLSPSSNLGYGTNFFNRFGYF